MTTALKGDMQNNSPSSSISNEASEGAPPCTGTLGRENKAVVRWNSPTLGSGSLTFKDGNNYGF